MMIMNKTLRTILEPINFKFIGAHMTKIKRNKIWKILDG